MAIITVHSQPPIDEIGNLSVQLQRFPYPAFVSDPITIILEGQLKFYIFLTFLFTAPMISKDVALEKELKLKVIICHMFPSKRAPCKS